MKKIVKVLSLVLLCVLAFTLTACAPKDGAAAKEKLEKKEYVVVVVNGTEEGNVECTVTATKNLIGGILGSGEADGLIATKYKTSAAAKEAYDSVVNSKDKQKYDNFKKVGKWVIIGTEQGIKDFK